MDEQTFATQRRYRPIWAASSEALRLFSLTPWSESFHVDGVGAHTYVDLCNGLRVIFTLGDDYLDDSELTALGGKQTVGWTVWDHDRDDSFYNLSGDDFAWGDGRTPEEAARHAVAWMVRYGMAVQSGAVYRCTYTPTDEED